ncbi:unnamed protein product [Bursaphelenchus xylophilus]|uniref:(pine wood nematode) hypothetical protein n=1 Tax=Bursaphelenchus xylophilus TaxID=6326 RepID=A0A1I7RNS7_BURXY|nr:unnamed protein product [Bursaphelenchus xylophilus]CAG9124260.1 unnamed protein product [Bursaphelenchus xylophilus]
MSQPGSSSEYKNAIKYLKNALPGFSDNLNVPEDQRLQYLTITLAQRVDEKQKTNKYCDMLSRDLESAHNTIDNLKNDRRTAATQIDALSRELEMTAAAANGLEEMRARFAELARECQGLREACMRYRYERDQLRRAGPDPEIIRRKMELENKLRRMDVELHNCEVSREKLNDYVADLKNEIKMLKQKEEDLLDETKNISKENVRLVGFRQRSDRCVDKLSKQIFKVNNEEQDILVCFETFYQNLCDFCERNLLFDLPRKFVPPPPRAIREGRSRKRKAPGRVVDVKPDLLAAYKELADARRNKIKPTFEIDVVSAEMRADEIKARGMMNYVESGLRKKMSTQSLPRFK